MDIDIGVLSYFLGEVTPYAVIGGTGYLAWRFVRAYERRVVAPDQFMALADLLPVADVLSVHASGRETLIGAAELAQLLQAPGGLHEHVLNQVVDLRPAPVQPQHDGRHVPAVTPVDVVERRPAFVGTDDAEHGTSILADLPQGFCPLSVIPGEISSRILP